MVLGHFSKRFLLPVGFLLSVPLAHAAVHSKATPDDDVEESATEDSPTEDSSASKVTTKLYEIRDSKCRFLERVTDGKRKWQVSTRRFEEGTRFPGIELARIPGKVVFKANDKLYVGERRCVPPYRPSFFKRLLGHLSVYGFINFSSFRDDLSISDSSSGSSSALRVLNTTICPGVGVSFTHSWYDISADSCFLFGKAQLTNSESVPLISYSAVNAPVFGVANTLHLLWISERGFVNFGVALPLYFRSGVWPVPAASLKVEPATQILWGSLLEARFERGHFQFTQSVGFLGKLHNFLWNIQGSWVF